MATNPDNLTIGQLPPVTPALASLLEVEVDGHSGHIDLATLKALIAPAPVRQAVTITAPSGGSVSKGLAPIASMFHLLHVQSDSPCRIRLYSTAQERDLDLGRDALIDPPPGSGCLFEGTTVPNLLQWNCSPIPMIQNADSPVRNLIAYTLEPDRKSVV